MCIETKDTTTKVPETTMTTLVFQKVAATWNEAVGICNDIGGILGNMEDSVKQSALKGGIGIVNQTSTVWV